MAGIHHRTMQIAVWAAISLLATGGRMAVAQNDVVDALFASPPPAAAVPAPANTASAPAIDPAVVLMQKRLDAIEVHLGVPNRPPSVAYNMERRVADLEKRVQQLEQQVSRMQQFDQRIRRLEMK